MAITMDISADMELLLQQKAAMQGQDIMTYLRHLAEKDTQVNVPQAAGVEEQQKQRQAQESTE